MPEKAQVILAIQDDISRDGVRIILERGGHSVAREFGPYDQADLVKAERAIRDGANLAVVDWLYGHRGGRPVVDLCKERKVPVVGFFPSAGFETEVKEWADEALNMGVGYKDFLRTVRRI